MIEAEDHPDRVRRAGVLLLAVLLVGSMTAGCLQAEEVLSGESSSTAQDADPGEVETTGVEASASEATWTRTLHYEPYIVASNGQPFQRFGGLTGDCETWTTFRVPSNATGMKAVLRGAPVHGTSAGYMTFMMRPSDGAWVMPNGTTDTYPHLYPRLPDRVEVHIPDPEPGTWDAWTWPNQLVVDHSWNLTITVQGEGGGAANVTDANPPGFFDCDRGLTGSSPLFEADLGAWQAVRMADGSLQVQPLR